ncbi:hypothetical protein EJB05_09676 [Eragrostis curvula]|uniref:F-box domain-containing protein n=1 Tax=Eragrostis curvula TaxID=38414 RepID=A0A5J9W4E3_9POAL|nr:hypothetical protein EJB05_09676 [Eragrostis curvula]
MPPKATKRWVPVKQAEGASRGQGGGNPAIDRLRLLGYGPLCQRVVPPKATKQWVPVNRAGGASRGRGGGDPDPDADHLSALPDALLHRILSYLKAWEVVRTCVLARRWRHLWASVPCIDLRVGQDDCGETPEDFPGFVHQLACRRDASAKLDTLRLRSSNVDGAYEEEDSKSWVRAAIKQGVRVIHLVGHRDGLATLEHKAFVSSHLKVLKLSYAMLDDKTLRKLSSHCPSLEELHLKDCLIAGHEISSASLKILTMFKCQISVNLSVDAPNLVLLRCILPISQAPSFKNTASLVTGTIFLDDRSFDDDFEDFSKDELDETTDDDDDWNDSNKKHKTRYGFGAPFEELLSHKDRYGYGSDIDSDDNTYEYGEIANDCDEFGLSGDGQDSSNYGNRNVGRNSGFSDNKILGGHNVLQILSNATSLELIADAGEVILNRELKRCPTFSNLKTLSLGEWCMDADFDALVFLLQHSPILETLFLELKLSFNTTKPLESGVKPKGRSFSCKHLQMVKIKCSKDDVRVHKVAHLFRANGVPVEKIFVHRTGSTHLRSKMMSRELARQELEFWEDDEFWDLHGDRMVRELARQELGFSGDDEFWGDDSEDDEF